MLAKTKKTITVNVHEAKTTLSKLIESSEKGDLVIIARHGEPVVQLLQLSPNKGRRAGTHPGLKAKGKFSPLPHGNKSTRWKARGNDLLLDTHMVLWWATNDSRLPRSVRNRIQRKKTRIVVSAASIWEILSMFKEGRLSGAHKLIADLPGYLRDQEFEFLPITAQHAVRAGLLDRKYRDPFDRILIAQATEDHLTLVS